MSVLMVHLSPVFGQLKNMKDLVERPFSLSFTQKIVVISATTGITILTVLARYFRRKKQVVDPSKIRRFTGRKFRVTGIRSPNGDVLSQASSGARRSEASSRFRRQPSIVTVSDRVSSVAVSHHSAPGGSGDGEKMTPQQFGTMGMEALEVCISYWEDAMASYTDIGPMNALLPADEVNFCSDLQLLLDAAYALQDQSELLFLDQRSVLFKNEGSTSGGQRLHRGGSTTSDAESFASAQDRVADLRDFEEFAEQHFPDLDKLQLYQEALKLRETGVGIPCRSIRSELVKCGSDGEFLAKLHCLRLAFSHLLMDRHTWSWFADAGRQMLADMLLYADKDPKDFLIGYEEMLKYVQDATNWHELERELRSRGVKALTFYDIVLDYILMDAFEDLEEPPSSVLAVVNNRWLSSGFKETALTTAVWSVLKAKKKMLKYPNGFMAHFYVLSEQISPLLAWGFLGPDETLRDTCSYFKEQVVGFLVDIFSFNKCRYTTVEELAADVHSHVRQRVDHVCQRLSLQG